MKHSRKKVIKAWVTFIGGKLSTIYDKQPDEATRAFHVAKKIECYPVEIHLLPPKPKAKKKLK